MTERPQTTRILLNIYVAETNDNEIAYLRGAVLPILTNVRDILDYEDDTQQLPIGLLLTHSIPLSERQLPSTTHGVCRLLHVRNTQATKALEKLLSSIPTVEVDDEGTTIVRLGNEVEVLIQDQVSYIRWQTKNKSGAQLHEMRVDAENPSIQYTLNTAGNEEGWYTHRIQLN